MKRSNGTLLLPVPSDLPPLDYPESDVPPAFYFLEDSSSLEYTVPSVQREVS